MGRRSLTAPNQILKLLVDASSKAKRSWIKPVLHRIKAIDSVGEHSILAPVRCQRYTRIQNPQIRRPISPTSRADPDRNTPDSLVVENNRAVASGTEAGFIARRCEGPAAFRRNSSA